MITYDFNKETRLVLPKLYRSLSHSLSLSPFLLLIWTLELLYRHQIGASDNISLLKEVVHQLVWGIKKSTDLQL